MATRKAAKKRMRIGRQYVIEIHQLDEVFRIVGRYDGESLVGGSKDKPHYQFHIEDEHFNTVMLLDNVSPDALCGELGKVTR